MRRDLLERRDRTIVALDRDDAGGAERQQRAGEAARPRAYLENRRVSERPGGARNSLRQIEIEKKILSERFSRNETMSANDLAQRR